MYIYNICLYNICIYKICICSYVYIIVFKQRWIHIWIQKTVSRFCHEFWGFLKFIVAAYFQIVFWHILKSLGTVLWRLQVMNLTSPIILQVWRETKSRKKGKTKFIQTLDFTTLSAHPCKLFFFVLFFSLWGGGGGGGEFRFNKRNPKIMPFFWFNGRGK